MTLRPAIPPKKVNCRNQWRMDYIEQRELYQPCPVHQVQTDNFQHIHRFVTLLRSIELK